MDKCRVEVGDKVKWERNLLSGDGSGERKWIEYEGIVEKVKYNDLSKSYDVWIRTDGPLGNHIVGESDLEIVEKDVLNGNKLEGNQIAMNL